MDFEKEPDWQSSEAATPETEMPSPGDTAASTQREPLKRLLIRNGERAVFVLADSIHWIEADGDFVRLHTAEASHRVRSTLLSLHARLDPNQFLRISRSAIVNLDFVAELRMRPSSDYDVLLHDGTILRFSRVYRNSFQQLGGMFAAPVEEKRRRCS